MYNCSLIPVGEVLPTSCPGTSTQEVRRNRGEVTNSNKMIAKIVTFFQPINDKKKNTIISHKKSYLPANLNLFLDAVFGKKLIKNHVRF